MRAAVTTPRGIELQTIDDPVPGPGQVLVRTLACGVCGSDLHALEHPGEMAELMRYSGAPAPLEPGRDVVFGHEFAAELVAHGPETTGALPVGSVVCTVPYAFGPGGPELIGFSHAFPGGFGERMVLQEATLVPVPDGLDPRLAALTEPLAVGEHSVAFADVQPGWPCLIVGCGPIGLAILLALKACGHGPIIASDLSPARRDMAQRLGADTVVDPGADASTVDFDALGVPSQPLQRTAMEAMGADVPRAVVFEAVGAPGMLQRVIDAAPAKARIVVAGVCMQSDAIEPARAVAKEVELRFSYAYTPAEFAATLQRIAAAPDTMAQLITASVALDDLPAMFDELRVPDRHVKVIVDHRQT